MRALAQLLEALGDVAGLEDLDDRRVGFAAGRTVVELGQVEHLNVLADLSVHASPALLAEGLLLQQAAIPVRQLEVLVPRIARQAVLHRVDHVRQRVEPDHVGGAIGCALRPADERPGQRIHDVEAQPECARVVESGQDREHPHPVGDEVRRVLGADHALAERGGEEALQRVEHARPACRAPAISSTRYM